MRYRFKVLVLKIKQSFVISGSYYKSEKKDKRFKKTLDENEPAWYYISRCCFTQTFLKSIKKCFEKAKNV